MTDPVSGLSRGYGFVRFHDLLEQQNALVQMNGVFCGHRPLRVSLATPKGSNSTKVSTEASMIPSAPLSPLSSSSTASSSLNNPNNVTQQMQARYHQLALQAPALVQQPTDPSNTTVFVGGLSAPINEEELRLYFASFGDITYVKIPPGKGCGFVQFVTRQAAEWAIEQMNGYQIGQSRIRLSWGRSQYDKTANGGGLEQQRSPPMMIQRDTSSMYVPPVSPTLSSPLSSYPLGNHDFSAPKRTMATQPTFSFPTAVPTTTLPPNNHSSYLR
jgi:RNA recognition motif-containing protein